MMKQRNNEIDDHDDRGCGGDGEEATLASIMTIEASLGRQKRGRGQSSREGKYINVTKIFFLFIHMSPSCDLSWPDPIECLINHKK